MTGTYASAGASLSYLDQGSGAPVVFLHPTPLDQDYWRPLLAQLPGIRAIVPDLRGHGASELGSDLPTDGFARVPDTPVLSMGQLAGDVLALLDHLSVESAVFAGCSIGGYVLLEIWRQAPQRMKALAFVCSKPQPDAEAALAKRAETIAKVRAEGVTGFFDTMAGALVGATTRRNHPAIIAEVRKRMTLTPEAVIAVQAGLATRPDSLPTVKTITVPVLSIAGGEDAAILPSDMQAFMQATGKCTSYVIPDVGHFAAYEQPATVCRMMSGWLAGL